MTKKEIAKRIEDCENELAELRKELNEPEYGGNWTFDSDICGKWAEREN